MAALGKLEGHDVVIVGWGGRGAWQLKYWRGWIGGVVGQPLAARPAETACELLPRVVTRSNGALQESQESRLNSDFRPKSEI
jgi:hypothetical protein